MIDFKEELDNIKNKTSKVLDEKEIKRIEGIASHLIATCHGAAEMGYWDTSVDIGEFETDYIEKIFNEMCSAGFDVKIEDGVLYIGWKPLMVGK